MRLHAIVRVGVAVSAALACAGGLAAEESDRPNPNDPYEVWLVDQATAVGWRMAATFTSLKARA
jgi:hypothetical protein